MNIFELKNISRSKADTYVFSFNYEINRYFKSFITGRGAVLTDKGEIEMDAIIINGTDLSTGK
jgi:hypothetical protein